MIRGNLLVIPVEDSLIYVEPLYLQAEQSAIPELTRVIVAYGDVVVMEKDLPSALDVHLLRNTHRSDHHGAHRSDHHGPWGYHDHDSLFDHDDCGGYDHDHDLRGSFRPSAGPSSTWPSSSTKKRVPPNGSTTGLPTGRRSNRLGEVIAALQALENVAP